MNDAAVKNRTPGHEQATAPEQVCRPSSEQEQAAEGERIRAQHPLQALLREADVRLDRGQRHEHDRGVEEHHEEGAAEERERPPAARVRGDGVHLVAHVRSDTGGGENGTAGPFRDEVVSLLV
jgi:hypothetical protein